MNPEQNLSRRALLLKLGGEALIGVGLVGAGQTLRRSIESSRPSNGVIWQAQKDAPTLPEKSNSRTTRADHILVWGSIAAEAIGAGTRVAAEKSNPVVEENIVPAPQQT